MINIFIYKNQTSSIFLLKEVIFKHTKATKKDQFIFLRGRASHEKATQQISYFSHAPIIIYEF